ncbi:Ankyrin repeat-containing protein [Cryptosporidium felis]|nr:Ankyrin repeat-containing protein [Cryptosporidium felis]
MLEKCLKLISKSRVEELKDLLGFDGFSQGDNFLISSKIENINGKSKKGQIPIHLACQIQDYETLKLLLRCEDLDVDVRDPLSSFTPVITLISSGGDIECLNLLLKRSPNLGLCDLEFGDSPLHWAVKLGLPKVVHRLVKSGMDVNLENPKSGQTPLHLAILTGNEDVITELIDLSANPIIKDDGSERNSTLHICILQNLPNSAMLIYKSATESQKETFKTNLDRNGNSPLHLAYLHGMLGLADFLVREGFPVNIANEQGLTPQDMKKEREEILEGARKTRDEKKPQTNKVKERKPKIKTQDEVFETPVSKFLLKHNIAERGSGSYQDGENGSGRFEFVFNLFYKKGYHYLDSSFSDLTFKDLTNIGIKDKGLKESILECIAKETKNEQERIQETLRKEREFERKRKIAYSLIAISTCLFIFFTIYVILNAMANNGQETRSRSGQSSFEEYRAKYDL